MKNTNYSKATRANHKSARQACVKLYNFPDRRVASGENLPQNLSNSLITTSIRLENKAGKLSHPPIHPTATYEKVSCKF